MKEERIFSDDIKINKYKLDEECEHQAAIYFYWADKKARALNRANEADDKVKLVSSQIELKLRKNWDEKKYGKLTENSIKSALETHEDVILAKQERNNAWAKVNTLTAAVSALEHRKDQLNNLRNLLIGGFFASPNGGKREGINDTANRDIRKKLNKES